MRAVPHVLLELHVHADAHIALYISIYLSFMHVLAQARLLAEPLKLSHGSKNNDPSFDRP